MLSDMGAVYPIPPSSGSLSASSGFSIPAGDPRQQSDARFRALAQMTGQIYWVADAQGRLIDSVAWCAFTGQTTEEAGGDGWAAAVHPDDVGPTLAGWTTAVASGHVYRHEHRVRRADGHYRMMLAQAYPVLAPDNVISEWVGVDTDITLLQELRADVQASQEEFRSTFERAAVGMAHVRLEDGHLLRVNQKFGDILGTSPEALIGRSFQELTYPADLDTNLALFERLLAGAISTYTLEKRYLRQDGSLVWVQLTASLKRDQAGQPEYGIAVVEDISARKTAEETLRQVEEELRARVQEWETIFASLNEGLIVIGAEGQVLRCNPAYEALVGWPAGSALYTVPPQERFRLLHIRDEQGQLIPFDQLSTPRLLQGETRVEEQIFRRQDGRDVYISLRGAPLTDPAGRVIGCVLVLHDTTEQRRLEQQTHQALQALLRMAKLLVQHSPEQEARQEPLVVGRYLAELACSLLGCPVAIILTLDPQTLVMGVLGTIGYTAAQDERLHTIISDWMHTSPDLAHLARLMAGETLVLDVAQPPYREFAELFEARQAIVAPMQLGGQMIGLVVFNPGSGAQQTFTDQQIALAGATAQLVGLVLERERWWREREEARARALALQESNRQMDTFLGLVSHELRTPLASMKMSLQLLRRTIEQTPVGLPTGGQLRSMESFPPLVETAERQMRRLERLVKELLNAVRIKENKLVLRLELTDLCTLVQEVVAEQRALTPERVIHMNPPLDQALMVHVDSDQIRQAVTNYLTNALKYSPETAPVVAGIEQEAEQARVWVRDQGAGIPKAEQEHLWERFHRVPGIQEQSGPSGGLGLGLYVTRMLIERHGGQVGMHSAPGEGSTFWFTLPLA